MTVHIWDNTKSPFVTVPNVFTNLAGVATQYGYFHAYPADRLRMYHTCHQNCRNLFGSGFGSDSCISNSRSYAAHKENIIQKQYETCLKNHLSVEDCNDSRQLSEDYHAQQMKKQEELCHQIDEFQKNENPFDKCTRYCDDKFKAVPSSYPLGCKKKYPTDDTGFCNCMDERGKTRSHAFVVIGFLIIVSTMVLFVYLIFFSN